MKKNILCLILFILCCNGAIAKEQIPFKELVQQQINELASKLSNDETNKLIDISKRIVVIPDEYQRECKAIYKEKLVLFYYPDTKTMSIAIFGKINYLSNSFVQFTELGLKYNDLIIMLPITNLRFDIVPYSCAGYGGTCRFYNEAFATFDSKQLSKLQVLFKDSTVIAKKRWYGGYNYKLQFAYELNNEQRLYPNMQYAWGLFIDNLGLHDLLYYGYLLQKIGYRWI